MNDKAEQLIKPKRNNSMSIGFQLIHGSTVILRQKTIYKQAQAYFRDGEIYAKAAGGYVKLKNTGGSSHPDISWLEMDGVKGKKKPKIDQFGYVEHKK